MLEGPSYNSEKRPAHGDPDDVGLTLPPFSGRFHGRPVYTSEGIPLSAREAPRFAERPDGTDAYPDDEKVPIESGLDGLYAYIRDSFPQDEAKKMLLELGEIVHTCEIASGEVVGKDVSGTEQSVGEDLPVRAADFVEASQERLRNFLEKHPKLTRYFKALLLVVSLAPSVAAKPETSFASDREMKRIYDDGMEEYGRRTAQFGVSRILGGQERFHDQVLDSERREWDLTERGNQARRDFIVNAYRFVDELNALENEYRLEFDRVMTRPFQNEAARSSAMTDINRRYLIKVIELENRLKDLSSRVDSITSLSVFGPLTGGRIRQFAALKEKMMRLALERSGWTRAKLEDALKKSGIEIPKNALDENEESTPVETRSYRNRSQKDGKAAETRGAKKEAAPDSDAQFLNSLF